jgi:serine/threonine-protein kinase
LFGPFAFDRHSRLLSRNGEELALPPRVLGVLELLLDRANDVVSRQELIDTVWKDAFVTDTSLAEAVSVLRQVLGDDPQSPIYIQTLHRRGYRFVAPISTDSVAVAADAVTGREAGATSPPVSPSIGKELVPWSVAVICSLIAAASLWHLVGRTPETPVAARFAIAPAPGTTFDYASPALALSPDGTQIVWSGCDGRRCQLYARPLDRIDPNPLAGSDDGRAPFFSPDGRSVGFFANGRLKKLALAGGAAITLADAPSPLGGVWVGREIIFAGSLSGGLTRVSEDGGEPRPLTIPRESAGEIRHVWPAIVPKSRVLLFTVDTTLPGAGMSAPGVLAALALDRASSSWRTLLAGVSVARAAAPDLLVFARDADLHVVAFDPKRLAVSGAPKALLGPVATARGRAHFALSETGALAHVGVEERARQFGVSLQPFTASGQQAWQLREAALAPDGQRLAGVNIEDARADIWIADVQRGAATRLTHRGLNTAPIWSADGRLVYFASRTDGSFELWRRDADGASNATRLFGSDRHAIPLAASPDGKLLAFLQTAEATRADIWGLPLEGGAPRPLVQGPFDETAASFSPDATLLAFQSAESGRWEVYVQRLRDGRRKLVSTEGGEKPVWMREGLYFQSGSQLLRASVVDDGLDLSVRELVAQRWAPGGALQGVAPDGRILLSQGADLPVSPAVVSLEWLREARSLLGPPASTLPR